MELGVHNLLTQGGDKNQGAEKSEQDIQGLEYFKTKRVLGIEAIGLLSVLRRCI